MRVNKEIERFYDSVFTETALSFRDDDVRGQAEAEDRKDERESDRVHAAEEEAFQHGVQRSEEHDHQEEIGQQQVFPHRAAARVIDQRHDDDDENGADERWNPHRQRDIEITILGCARPRAWTKWISRYRAVLLDSRSR